MMLASHLSITRAWYVKHRMHTGAFPSLAAQRAYVRCLKRGFDKKTTSTQRINEWCRYRDDVVVPTLIEKHKRIGAARVKGAA